MLNTQQALAQHANANTITQAQVKDLLKPVKGVTFANITYVTRVATSAAHKLVDIKKVTRANVQLFNNLTAFTSAYVNAVKRTAAKIDSNLEEAVANFTVQDTYFKHTDCYSLVEHNTNGRMYLYAIYNNATSEYLINNQPATKQQVAEYLTASAKATLLDSNKIVTNVANNIEHTVQVRTIALENIVSIKAQKQTVTV